METVKKYLLNGTKVIPVSINVIPEPHPAFYHLQYGKVGRAWYLFSCEHDVIRK